MRVDVVEGIPIRIKADQSLLGGTSAYESYQTVLVRAVCDGVEGWGEAMTRLAPEATALLVQELGRLIVGTEFDDVRSAWNKLWHFLRLRGHTRGSDVEAISGIEIALTDAYARIEKRSIRSIFHRNPANEVPVYAGSIFKSRGSLEEQVELSRARGLSGAKVKIGFGIQEDVTLLKEVRRLWPNGMLVADANGAYNARLAAEACKKFEDFRLAWFEEPVLSDDWDGYRKLVGGPVRIGGGESWFVADLDVAIRDGLIGVLEPSVSRCGGIGTILEAGKKAVDKRMGFSPMTGMNSGISLAASLQVAAVIKSEGVEYNPFQNPLQWELVEGIPEPKGGSVVLPQGHGLGVTIDMGYLRKHRI